ncbi:hypothetical protein EVAR_67191_1 [Eumeta japonica]|uniref:Uncharacterized protein n=1 Tax=Eumeta variegata TaxID=151549 RepID=A0A4C2A5P3_EUMVA|nr:hypothetical protein EVAR_67191_1 [Eumeta japonica]
MGRTTKKRHSVSLSAAVDKRRAPNSGVGNAVKSEFNYYLQNQPSVGIPDIVTKSNHGRQRETSVARVQPIAVGAPPVMESSPSETIIIAPTTVPDTDIAIAQAKERLARAEAELARASLERIEAESALSEDEAAPQIDKAAMRPLHVHRRYETPLRRARIVHDAAVQARGTSLNKNLLAGPNLLQSLPAVLRKFRQHRRSDQQKGQPTEYRTTRVIFGAASSTCKAIYVKNSNAEKHRESFPAAATGIVQNHYMDDNLQSFPMTEEAIKITREVALIHSHAHFTLQKWRSNDELTLNALKPEPRQVNKKLSCGSNEEKMLGLIWRPKSNTLAFDLDLKRVPKGIVLGQKRPTKREILKTAMSVFDSLDIPAPLNIAAKRILQATWKLGTDWDEEVPNDVYKNWNIWLEHLQALRKLDIPQCTSRTVENNLCTTARTSSSRHGSATSALRRERPRRQTRLESIEEETKTTEWHWVVTAHNVTNDATCEPPAVSKNHIDGFTAPSSCDIPRKSDLTNRKQSRAHHLRERSAHTPPGRVADRHHPSATRRHTILVLAEIAPSHSPSSAICRSMQSGTWPYRRDAYDITQN